MSDIQAELIYDDFWLLDIEVDTLAKLKITGKINEDTGEAVLTPHLDPSNLKDRHKKTKIIIAPDGSVVYPQSLYLVSKLRGGGKVKDTNSIAKALLLFTRFLDSTHSSQEGEDGNEIPPECLTYKSLSKYEEEGAPWRFADFLKKNCRHRQSDGGEAWSLTTARTYMSAVIGFYKWMQKFGYLKNNDDHIVTHFSKGTYLYEGYDQHDMLSHTKSSTKREYEISNIMKEFPRSDSTPAHKKLKPMSFDHKELFSQHIDTLPKAISLILRLCEESGLRIDEATHFPARNIGDEDCSELEVVPVHITHTKGSKPRTIEIPIALYEELEQYKESNQRQKNLTRRKNLIDSKEERDTTDYLFVSNKGLPYEENTLEVHFSVLRKRIRAIEPSWYYRIHDLRSTFATHWLWKEHQSRHVDYDFLMDELAYLMGHSSTKTTQKYVTFMDKRDNQLSVAKSKNRKISGGW
ncbi:tyrosine-type recombinase/integrase [Vibrio cyclitrophicus]